MPEFSEMVKNFFITQVEEEEVVYKLNESLHLDFPDVHEAGKFLVEVIRHWQKNIDLFCGSHTYTYDQTTEKRIVLPEKAWTFSWKDPSTCGSCVRPQRIFDKIFGDRKKFYQTPAVQYQGDRVYEIEFDVLLYFSQYGEEKTKQYIKDKEEKIRHEAEKKERLKNQLKRMKNGKKLKKKVGSCISSSAKKWILDYLEEDKYYQDIKLVKTDIVVMLTDRSEWGSSGGIGYFDQIRVFYHGQTDMKEWQWRDRWSASKDRHDLRINKIGKVEILTEEKIAIKIELVNKEYGNRWTIFEFEKIAVEPKTLDAKSRASFKSKVKNEIQRIHKDLLRLWECKPKMIADYGDGSGYVVHVPAGTPTYVEYRQPSIKQEIIKTDIGIAAFITEEQIDHRGSDPQMRYELYLVKNTNGKAERILEDHNYEKREGSALISIVDLTKEKIAINTKNGRREIKI